MWGLRWAQVEPGEDLVDVAAVGLSDPPWLKLLHSSAPGFFPLRLLGSGVRLDSVESVGPQRPVLLTWHSVPLCEMLCKLKANFEKIPFKTEKKCGKNANGTNFPANWKVQIK